MSVTRHHSFFCLTRVLTEASQFVLRPLCFFPLWSELRLLIASLSAQCFGRDLVLGVMTRTFPSCLRNNVIVFAGRSVDEWWQEDR